LEDFKTDGEAFQDEMRQRVGELLDSAKKIALEQRQNHWRKLVQAAFFGIIAPGKLVTGEIAGATGVRSY
jgi:hypothetical protein